MVRIIAINTIILSGVYEYFPNSVGRIPIVDAKNNDQEILSNLVDKISVAMENLYKVKSENDKINAQKIVKAINLEIDSKIYELYGLTKSEIKIIEDSIKKTE